MPNKYTRDYDGITPIDQMYIFEWHVSSEGLSHLARVLFVNSTIAPVPIIGLILRC